MSNTFLTLQIILAILVSILVFLQSKGSGLSKSIASKAYHTNRGLEVVLFRLTIFFVVLFVVISIWSHLYV